LIRPVFRTIIFGLLLGVLLISSGCRFLLVPSGQELENVPGAYTYSQGSTDYPHLYQQAVKHLEKNEFNQAEALYRDLIAKEPEGANGYIGLGTSLNLQARYMEAREAYETALAIAPDSVDALIGLAAAFVRQGLHPQAADTYRQALALDPENPNAHYGLGTVLVLLGEVEEGIEHYEKVIELAPNSGLAAQAEIQVGELSQEGK
jgi:tetratricopeptide (TPR) repeat protein